MTYFSLAYYKFTPVEDPHLDVQKHKDFFQNRDMSGRIYISREGINGQLSGFGPDVEAYMEWFRKDPRFSDINFKIHSCEGNIFPRMTVKVKEQLVALDAKVDPAETAPHLSPADWKKTLESEEDFLLLDVRNQYEWEIGHFENATLPPLETFRDFLPYTEQLAKEVDPKKKVLMYCTGGIRCELYSVLLKNKGFENVYQLEGGILGYGLNEGADHWKGKVFVFDDRLAIPIDGKEETPITVCLHCQLPADTYYNCANMDCNELFICCDGCVDYYKGCCSHACVTAPRVRAFDSTRGNKPFRRKHLLES